MTGGTRDGRIITFYSYKGGTGRSMALANVAWLLACSGKRVLAIDWDLEAPGLHRYFAPFLIDPELFSSEGMIDFVWDLSTAALTPGEAGRRETGDLAEMAEIGDYVMRVDWEFPGGGELDLIPAGKQGSHYSERVNAFDWDNFYERLGGGRALNAAREELKCEYDYVLIDSRTGVSDTSGICTVQMPDALVVLFTLNKQGIRGASAVAGSVRRNRAAMPIFPVPTRIDSSEADKLRAGLRQAKAAFAPFLADMEPEAVDEYWGSVEFPYVPYFAFEEVLAPFAEARGRKSTLLAAATRLARYTTGLHVTEPLEPDEDVRQRVVSAYAHEDGAPLGPMEPPAPSPARPAEWRPMERPAVVGTVAPRRRSPLMAMSALLIVLILAGAVGWISWPRDPAPPSQSQKLAALGSPVTEDSVRVRYLVELYRSGRRDFEGVDLSRLNLNRQRLPEIRLPSATLVQTRLADAVLQGADLSGADLSGADLRGADLSGAVLVGANLSGADLSGASLDGANLFRARIERGALVSAVTTSTTMGSDSSRGPYRADEDINTQLVGAGDSLASPEGYIWIGNYDRTQGGWAPARITALNRTPVSVDPQLLLPGARFRVAGNMTLRQLAPNSGPSYFSGVVSLGTVPRGTVVEIREAPRAYPRRNLTQYWARVRVSPAVGEAARVDSAATRSIPVVYIQFQGSVTREVLNLLREHLGRSGFAAPGAQRITPSFESEVRYFHEEDAEVARQVAESTRAFFEQRNCPVELPVRRIQMEARPGQVEVWVSISCLGD
ncbi:MAG TPA: pentapeptide repeat-containing protein [Longimicrobium sp.]|jgi:hypothetical protein